MTDPYTTVPDAQVGILMGSSSDWPAMEHAAKTLSFLRAQKLVRRAPNRHWICYHDRVREALSASV